MLHTLGASVVEPASLRCFQFAPSGNYIAALSTTHLLVYGFDGETITFIDDIALAATISNPTRHDLSWSTDDFILVDGNNGTVYSYAFNGAVLSLADSISGTRGLPTANPVDPTAIAVAEVSTHQNILRRDMVGDLTEIADITVPQSSGVTTWDPSGTFLFRQNSVMRWNAETEDLSLVTTFPGNSSQVGWPVDGDVQGSARWIVTTFNANLWLNEFDGTTYTPGSLFHSVSGGGWKSIKPDNGSVLVAIMAGDPRVLSIYRIDEVTGIPTKIYEESALNVGEVVWSPTFPYLGYVSDGDIVVRPWTPAVSINVLSPEPEDVLLTSTMNVSWETTEIGGPFTYNHRVFVVEGPTIVYDSGLLSQVTQEHTIPEGYLENDHTYTLVVQVVDSSDWDTVQVAVPFFSAWTAPPTITGVTVTAVGGVS